MKVDRALLDAIDREYVMKAIPPSWRKTLVILFSQMENAALKRWARTKRAAARRTQAGLIWLERNAPILLLATATAAGTVQVVRALSASLGLAMSGYDVLQMLGLTRRF